VNGNTTLCHDSQKVAPYALPDDQLARPVATGLEALSQIGDAGWAEEDTAMQFIEALRHGVADLCLTKLDTRLRVAHDHGL
jgi:hypothetical protein